MLELLKFDAAKHPRDDAGRFSGTASVADGKPAPVVIRADGPRSLTRGEAWQRTGAKIAELPASYTGSRDRELPVGSFTTHKLVHQIPHDMDLREDAGLRSRLFGIVKQEREGAVAKGRERGLIPDGTEPRAITRAYNHGAMLALHDHGAVDYDFKMDDDLKAQMKPMEDFIRYARRRVKSKVLGQEKGSWKPYRAAFGKPFKNAKFNKETGEQRLRVRPNDVLIKAVPSPPVGQSPGATGPLQAGQVSRWDRMRVTLARSENAGNRSFKPLTMQQRLERKHAAVDERLKLQQGGMRLNQGMLGSLKGLNISKRPGLQSALSTGPKIDLGALSRPAAPAVPDMTKLAPSHKVAPAAHDMMPDHLKHITAPTRRIAAPRPVAAMMPTVNAILSSSARQHDPRPNRFRNTQAVADHKAPIGHIGHG